MAARIFSGELTLRVIARTTVIVMLAFAAASCTHTAPADTAVTTPAAAHQKPLAGPAWPRFRGVNNDGLSSQKGINKQWSVRPPALLWQQTLGDGGYSGFSVADGIVYIVDHSGFNDAIRAFDLRNGAEKWRYEYQDAVIPKFGFARSTPTVDEGRVYAYSRMGKLMCLDASTGRLIWQEDIVGQFNGVRPGWDMASSPLVDGDKVVVCAGGPNAAIVAINKMTGDTLWAGGGSDKPGYSSPEVATINGFRQYVCFLGTSLVGVDPASGRLIWSFPWKTGSDVNAAAPLVIGDSIFITTGYGHGCAMIDIQGGVPQLRWQNKEMQAHFASPIFAGGYIYGTGNPGLLVCLDPQTGNALWKQPGFEKGSIIGVDGTIIGFDGASGDLIMAAISPQSYQEMGRFTPIGGQSWTSPVVAYGRIIVRNKSTLACFDAM
jgi:outer membrane protein assembly factor BamB